MMMYIEIIFCYLMESVTIEYQRRVTLRAPANAEWRPFCISMFSFTDFISITRKKKRINIFTFFVIVILIVTLWQQSN